MKKLILAAVVLACVASTATAQQTFFRVRIDNVAKAFSHPASGVFNTPEGATDPGPLFPGNAYTFTFYAAPGASLSFATMFVQSNDLFYAPDETGIALWDENGDPISGDVTNQILLWDAGTEQNEEPGLGANQAPRQAGADTGTDEDGTVVAIADGQAGPAGFSYPNVADVIRVTITHEEGTRFTVRIENVSTSTTLMPSDGSTAAVPLAPGVWVVHTAEAPLFTTSEADREEGLEALAEDGSSGGLGDALAAVSGISQIMAPGVWVVHTQDAPLFTTGEADRGQGLEAIAEDGSPSSLAAVLANEAIATGGAFAVPEGASGPGPLTPGSAYEFTIAATPGAYLSFATMFVQSNDLFYAPDETGIALWDENGDPISGDVTDQLLLWDAGTEVNEAPGFGLNQAPRQAGADMGEDEDGIVVAIADEQTGPGGFTYPDVADVIQVTVTPLETSTFNVRIENVSQAGTLTPSDGSQQAVPISPGVWVVHADANPLFTTGDVDRGRGLAAIAEDGNPADLSVALAAKVGFGSSVFNTPVGAENPAPIGPGGAYEFSVDAAPGAYLSFATMFVPSNDLFYGPPGTGISLFGEDGTPRTGDLTSEVFLWDTGSEVNEEPGVGPNQVQRQASPNTGPDENGPVVLIADGQAGPGGFAYPNVADVIQVTVNEVRTANEDAVEGIPQRFQLHQNYPNPFNPETLIRFDLNEAGPVRLSIYNVLGQKVTELVSGVRAAGTHQVRWDGRDAQGLRVASGIYLYRLDVDATSAVRRMVLLQ